MNLPAIREPRQHLSVKPVASRKNINMDIDNAPKHNDTTYNNET